jgi:hypothetical protein
MAKDLTAIRINADLIEALKRITANAPKDSAYSDRSVNWLIGRAVEEFVQRLDAAPKPKTKAKPATPAATADDPTQGF